MATLLFTAIIATYGLCQNTLDGPAEIDSVLKPTSLDTHPLSPLGNTETFAIECQYHCRSTIASLFFARCPTAIVLFVIPAVVDSVELIRLGRSFAHVVQECLKRVTPTGAYRNASTAVARVTDIARRFASSDHRPPARVCRRSVHPVGLATLGRDFACKATATPLRSSLQDVSVGRAFRSAITLAIPDQQVSSPTPSETVDYQSAETSAGQITRIVKRWRGGLAVNNRRVVGSFHLTRLLAGVSVST